MDNKDTFKKLCEEVEEAISSVIEDGLQVNDVEVLKNLTKIYKNVKESEQMNYGNYGYNYGNYGRGNYGRGGYGEYGRGYGEYNEGSYGRRGRDAKYRGDDHLDRMYNEYGRYQENRNRYGASEETDKSFHYMLEAYKDFTKVLFEEAETPQQKQMLREAIQQNMM